MNKLAIAAAVVLALVLLGLPPIVASVTEARVRERVAAIDSSDTVAAEVTSFARGWFRSSANIALRVEPDGDPAADGAQAGWLAGEPLSIAVELAHGPVAVLDGVHFGWSSMVARLDEEAPGVAELTTTLGVPYVFEFRGRTSFSGSMAFDADAPAFELPLDETLIGFSGADLDGVYAGRQLTARAAIARIEVTSPTGTFELHGVSATADNELLSEYVLPGRASVAIERVTIVDAFRGAEPVFDGTDFSVASVTELDAGGDLLEMRIDYEVDSVRIDTNVLAEPSIGMTLRNIDVAAVEAYSAAANDAAAGAADPVAIVRALAPELERALRAGPSLSVDPIRFRLDDEPFEARVDLTANTTELPAAGALNLDNPLLVLGLVDADAEVRLSKALAQRLATLVAKMQLARDGSLPPDELAYLAEAQSALMLAMLAGQGVLIEDGSDYRSAIELTNGRLTVNGEALPFGLP
jgi:uncharacterized protein YdgA (DUF945 family)